MDNSNLVSIVVPAYNSEEYILDCINSLLGQTYTNIEIVCVDDGSTDSTLTLLQSIKDSRLSVVSQPNGGVSAARNKGILLSKGEFVTFVDSDDFVSDDYIEALVYGIKDCDISECDYQIINDHKYDRKRADSKSYSFNIMMYDSYLAMNGIDNCKVTAKLYRRSVIKDVLFIEGIQLGEDILFLNSLERAKTINRCNNKLYYYYINAGSLSHSNKDNFKTVEIMFKVLDNSCENNVPLLHNAYMLSLSCWYTAILSEDVDKKNKAKKMLIKCRMYKSNMGKKERVVLDFVARCPLIYRFYRIAKDPDMLKIEIKRMKEKVFG